jgi:hypothetical protein
MTASPFDKIGSLAGIFMTHLHSGELVYASFGLASGFPKRDAEKLKADRRAIA